MPLEILSPTSLLIAVSLALFAGLLLFHVAAAAIILAPYIQANPQATGLMCRQALMQLNLSRLALKEVFGGSPVEYYFNTTGLRMAFLVCMVTAFMAVFTWLTPLLT